MESDRNDTDALGEAGFTVLNAIGDRELWYAEGGYDPENNNEAAWRFPLHVDWKIETKTGREYAAVFPAVCPHYKFTLILRALFEVHDRAGQENRWLILKDMVPALLKKAPGITVERYYRWNGDDRPVSYTEATLPGNVEPNHLKSGVQDRLLIRQIADAAGVQSSVVKIVIDGLNKVAADYLVHQHRVMDLGFIKLVAVPFRANWKEIVSFKLRKLGLLNFIKEDVDQSNTEGLPETLCSTHNVALRRDNRPPGFLKKGYLPLSRIDYTVEAVTSRAFEKEVTKIETGQRSVGHTQYVSYYEKTVERLYENILEILSAYRKKIGLPFARICESRSTGGLRFVETRGIKANAHGRNLRDLPVHIVPPARGFSAIAEESQQELVCEAPPEVPKLPAFSQAIDDVRECLVYGEMEKLSNGEGGDSGLPMLDACESEAPRESMFPSDPIGWEPPRMDEKGD